MMIIIIKIIVKNFCYQWRKKFQLRKQWTEMVPKLTNSCFNLSPLRQEHKDVVTALWQRRAIDCIDVVSFFFFFFFFKPTSVDNVVRTLRSDVLAILWQRSANFLRTLQIRNYRMPCNVFSTLFQCCLS